MNENPNQSLHRLVYVLIGALALLLFLVIYLYLRFESQLLAVQSVDVFDAKVLPIESDIVAVKPLTEEGLAVDFVDSLFENEKSTTGNIVRLDTVKREITIEGSITDMEKVLAGQYKFGTELPQFNRNFVLMVDQRVNLADFKIGDEVVILTDKSLHLDAGVSVIEMIKSDFEYEEPWAP